MVLFFFSIKISFTLRKLYYILQLKYQFINIFAECSLYRINTTTKNNNYKYSNTFFPHIIVQEPHVKGDNKCVTVLSIVKWGRNKRANRDLVLALPASDSEQKRTLVY